MHPVFYKTIITGMILFLILVFFSYLMIRKLLKEIEEKDLESLKAIIHAQERERTVIAQEIHDNLAPTLSIAQMQISFLAENDSVPTDSLLLKIQRQLQDAVILCRDISHTLSPDLTKDSDIRQVLNHYIEKINHTGKLIISFEDNSDLKGIEPEAGTSVIRIVQELINNTLKHSGASRSKLTIFNDADDLVINYTDNGKGLSPKTAFTGMGMRNIEKRVQILKGKINWRNSNSQGGFNALIKFPLNLFKHL